ncbi:helix-turn-helix domain-containing protein [Methylocapsa sp. D3K7]|uniref:MarR family transcriptional regulator n=1 Tax=Methylocapsa sp. D3K7 TaxID=3041435 RepID=UPI00244EF2E3|nr:helix-turn-helix domain-containing protein [Methylocapsa sp. D3K7]WGJ15090.1 helix-turn-helix domain-containing protein [Methylocapsa sp. D3K7]
MPQTQNTDDDGAWISKAISFLGEFRKFNPDVTANTILTFLHVAKQPGITQKDIMKALGLADSGQSRTVATLSKYGDRGRAGWNVVDLDEDPRRPPPKAPDLEQKGRTHPQLTAEDLQQIGGHHMAVRPRGTKFQVDFIHKGKRSRPEFDTYNEEGDLCPQNGFHVELSVNFK